MKELWMGGAVLLTMLISQDGQQKLNAPEKQTLVELASLPAGPLPQQQQQQQQSIPDAPKPQTTGLTGVGSVTPGKGTTSTSNGDDATAAANDGSAPGTSLPAAPGAAEEAASAGPAPTLPDDGSGPGALGTLVLRSNFVDVPFTVKDSKGKLVPGLEWRDVQVYENNVRQHMAVFTRDPFPLSVAFVIDQSLTFDAMQRVNNALGALQGAFAPYDEIAIFTYNHGAKMQTDFTAAQSPRVAAVIERSKSTGEEPMFYDAGTALGSGINLNNGAERNLAPLGQGQGHVNGLDPQVARQSHTLNDAILEAAKATTRAGKDRRRVVYVISDGKEFGSVAKTKDVIKYLQTNKIALFATVVGDSAVEGLGFLDSVHLPMTMRDNILPVYARATGGEAYAEYRQKGIETSFQRIAEEVRTQYTVGYYSSQPVLDSRFRNIEVKVLRGNLNVIAKKGYYPTASAVPPPAVRPTSAPATP